MQRREQTLLEDSRPCSAFADPAVTSSLQRRCCGGWCYAGSSLHLSQSVLPRTAELCTWNPAQFPSFSLRGLIMGKVFTSNLFITLPSTCSLANCYLSSLGTDFIGSASCVASLGWVRERKRGSFNSEFISMYSFSFSFTKPFVAPFQLPTNTEIKVLRGDFE